MQKERQSREPPHPLTGGVGPTRDTPDVSLSPPCDGYRLLVQGWDTVVETFDLVLSSQVEETLEAARQVAEELDPDGGAPHTIQFGGEDCQIQARRPKAGRFVIFNDDFQVTFRSPRIEWGVTVRYWSAGLWEYGFEALRARVMKMLLSEMRPRDPDDWQRVSRADWAFDFEAPRFTGEMRPGVSENVVCHSSVKKRSLGTIDLEEIGAGVRVETLTIGSLASLQVQVYDKGREITEASGKDWMLKMWAAAAPDWEPELTDAGMVRHVWRLEVRMGKEFLKNRQCNRLEALLEHLDELLAEVLFTRRLVSPAPGDSNRWRWPLHPLWSEAYRATAGAAEMRPLGHQITMAGDAIKTALLKNAAGNIRAATVLEVGDFDHLNAEALADKMLELMHADPDNEAKAARAGERYRYVNEAR